MSPAAPWCTTEVTQVARSNKSIPVCLDCGRYTCTDCGVGFVTKDEYLRHRIDPLAHSGSEPASMQA